jgi:3-dehydroquinate dehydratase/shikimate dehydrogenase
MPSSLLCETVTGRSTPDLLAARDAATGGDMVELRLDGVAALDVAAALRGRRLPVIATCRPIWEGGRYEGSETARAAILERALALGAEYVDIEWRALNGAHADAFRRILSHAPARIVVSSHDFEGVPADLHARARDMRASGAGVVKIAVAATRLSDTLPLIDVARAGNTVVIGMGDAGVPTRLLAARYGSKWTYAGNGVAPGQMPARRMVHDLRFRAVGPATRLFGVISTNAMHSISPSMHNAAFEAADLDAVYVPLRAADFGDFLTFAETLGIEGASVTIPFKLDALNAAAHTDDLTRRVGAANTLRRFDDGWEATNTDVAGFLAPLDDAFGRPLKGARAAVIGAGGSARAVVVALVERGCRVTVHARRADQAAALQSLGALAGEWPVAAGGWDLLVNCTPLGGASWRDESPVPRQSLTGALVYDLTYGPDESRLVRDARAAGCAAIDGLPMLVAQAERQFEWWTGQPPEPDVMRNAAYGRLQASVTAPR